MCIVTSLLGSYGATSLMYCLLVCIFLSCCHVLCSEDTTRMGHILGEAKLRTSTPAPERDLQPPAICILRAIMHSAFLMCSCHNPDKLPDPAQLIKPAVNPKQLPQFFWMHLRKDIEHLSRVTGEGMEESAIIVHLVLQDMLFYNDHSGR